jgi:hypothetical protein
MKLDYTENVVYIKAKLEEEMSKLDEKDLDAYRRDTIHSIMRDAYEKIINIETARYLIDAVYPGIYLKPQKFRNDYFESDLLTRVYTWWKQ